MFQFSGGVPPTSVASIGPDELPPPYQRSGVPMVTCRVCQAMIDISNKRDQHVVKCISCNEATVSIFKILNIFRIKKKCYSQFEMLPLGKNMFAVHATVC